MPKKRRKRPFSSLFRHLSDTFLAPHLLCFQGGPREKRSFRVVSFRHRKFDGFTESGARAPDCVRKGVGKGVKYDTFPAPRRRFAAPFPLLSGRSPGFTGPVQEWRRAPSGARRLLVDRGIKSESLVHAAASGGFQVLGTLKGASSVRPDRILASWQGGADKRAKRAEQKRSAASLRFARPHLNQGSPPLRPAKRVCYRCSSAGISRPPLHLARIGYLPLREKGFRLAKRSEAKRSDASRRPTPVLRKLIRRYAYTAMNLWEATSTGKVLGAPVARLSNVHGSASSPCQGSQFC